MDPDRAGQDRIVTLSVIIPNYNDRRVERALSSVVRQNYPSVELVVVDGASPDPGVHRIYEKFPNIHLICEPDEGLFDALNKGIQSSSGEVIYLMGADDELSTDTVFSQAIDRLVADPSLDGISIGCDFVNAQGRIIRSWYPRRVSGRLIKMGIYPPHFSLFLKRRLYHEVGVFDIQTSGGLAADSLWLIDLACVKPHVRIGVIDTCSLRMEYGGTSTGSAGGVVKQFHVVRRYVKSKRLKTAAIHPWVKVLSKLFQFRVLRRRGSAKHLRWRGRTHSGEHDET
jgi:glycosyltransferase